jgi:hypothetical protein
MKKIALLHWTLVLLFVALLCFAGVGIKAAGIGQVLHQNEPRGDACGPWGRRGFSNECRTRRCVQGPRHRR